MKLDLPFLAFSTQRTGRSGAPLLGWSVGQVDVPECGREEFRLAVVVHQNSEWSTKTYAGLGSYWTNAMVMASRTSLPMAGVNTEKMMPADSAVGGEDWVRSTVGNSQLRSLRSRAKADGARIPLDRWGSIICKRVLDPSEASQCDWDDVEDWAAANLVVVERRLFRRVAEPSRVITWTHQNYRIGNRTEIVRRPHHPLPDGRGDSEPGLHFSFLDEDFDAVWKEIYTAHPRSIAQWDLESATARHLSCMLADDIHDHRLPFELTKCGCFDREALSMADTSRPTDWMETRSVVGIAEALLARSVPQLKAPGPEKDALMALKSVLTAERGEGFADQVGNAFASLPQNGQPIRDWFIAKAVERWQSRRITLPPIFNIAVP